MTGSSMEEQIAALEQARARVEAVLSTDEDWLAFRAAAGSARLVAERALAGSPLYKCWNALDRAIQDLQAMAARQPESGVAPDDLTRIRGIDRSIARRLADLGISTFGQLAAWRADEVRNVAEALGLGRRISRQNWIEQAALLALRRPAGSPRVIGPGSAATPGSTPVEPASPIPQARTTVQRIELRQILEHIRSTAALRGDPPPAAHDLGDEIPDANAATVADIALPAQSSPATAVAASPHSNSETTEREQPEQEERPAAGTVDSAPCSDSAGRPEPEEATVTFVIREYPTPVDDLVRERDDQDRSPPFDRRPAVRARDATHSLPGVEAEEAEVVIVSRSADRVGRPGRRSVKAGGA